MQLMITTYHYILYHRFGGFCNMNFTLRAKRCSLPNLAEAAFPFSADSSFGYTGNFIQRQSFRYRFHPQYQYPVSAYASVLLFHFFVAFEIAYVIPLPRHFHCVDR